MAKIYYEKDASLEVLKERTIAIIGYGNQGHAQAQNLKDSGLRVIIADLKGSKNWRKAEEAGFEVMEAKEAAQRADVIHFLMDSTSIFIRLFLLRTWTSLWSLPRGQEFWCGRCILRKKVFPV